MTICTVAPNQLRPNYLQTRLNGILRRSDPRSAPARVTAREGVAPDVGGDSDYFP